MLMMMMMVLVAIVAMVRCSSHSESVSRCDCVSTFVCVYKRLFLLFVFSSLVRSIFASKLVVRIRRKKNNKSKKSTTRERERE